MPRRAWLLALAVVALLAGAGGLELAARAQETTFGEPQTVRVPAGVAFERTFAWRGSFDRLPSPVSEPAAALWLRVDSSQLDGVADSAVLLRIDAEAVLNGVVDARESFVMHGAGGLIVTGTVFTPEHFERWRYGANEVEVRATVSQEPVRGMRGFVEVTVGPVEVVHVSGPTCEPRPACRDAD